MVILAVLYIWVNEPTRVIFAKIMISSFIAIVGNVVIYRIMWYDEDTKKDRGN